MAEGNEPRHQLDELGVDVRLSTALTALPTVEAGRAGRFAVTTDTGEQIVADVWFQAFGVQINTGYLADGSLSPLTEEKTVPGTERLTVQGYEHIYATGDIAALTDPKMASYAMTRADIVVNNIKAQLDGDQPDAVHTPAPERRILLPLGTRAGVGQLPTPDGVAAATVQTVYRRKGADLFTARFASRFGRP